jgi:hypothetical protein
MCRKFLFKENSRSDQFLFLCVDKRVTVRIDLREMDLKLWMCVRLDGRVLLNTVMNLRVL